MSQLVYLDDYTLNPGDLSWEPLEAIGPLTRYPRTSPDQVVARAQNATILLVNKVQLTAAVLDQLPALRFICVTATGYNNVDISAAHERGIIVSNAVGYSTASVVQQVFALLFALTNQVKVHAEAVNQGDWANCPDFAFWRQPIPEVAGRTMGIYGFGTIGQAVARVALALGMSVIATHRHPERDAIPGVSFVPVEQLFSESDVLSLHAPYNKVSAGIVNAAHLARMKPTAYLVNTARGGLVVEEDLRAALAAKKIAGAGLDVLSSEPPPADHPLIGLENCLITPHHAWASQEARQRLLDITVENIKAFLAGEPQNVVSNK